jgi:polyhydroxyalkanoate synthesis regulator phasin
MARNEQTAAEILISMGARYNADAVRIGDMIHDHIVKLQQSRDALQEQVDALLAELAELKEKQSAE